MSSFVAAGAVQISSSYTMAVVGFTQSMASVSGILQPPCMVISSLLAAHLIQIIGPFKTYHLGNVLTTLGCFMVALCGICPWAREGLWWIGWAPIIGVGFGLHAGPATAIFASRVDSSAHGKLFTGMAFFGSGTFGLGGMGG